MPKKFWPPRNYWLLKVSTLKVNYIINAQYNYNSIKCFIEKCDKEENVEVTVAAITSYSKRRV